MRVTLKSLVLVISTVVMVGGCSTVERDRGINDPNEHANRKMHEFNRGLDSALLKPTSQVYGSIVPQPAIDAISNFSSNLELPVMILNNLLQFDLGGAANNTLRFAFNSTFGVAGLFDMAGSAGIYEQTTDFGKTLSVYGVGEGAYVELPGFGPSTERDAAGIIVDFAINPLNFILPNPEKYIGTAAKVLDLVGDRHTYSDLVDSLLYESEDSYAQARQLYLENRRFDLSGEIDDAEYEDPYADFE